MNNRINGRMHARGDAYKNQSKLKVGEWYLSINYPERGPGQLKEIRGTVALIYHPKWAGGHNGGTPEYNYKGNHCMWYIIDELTKADKHKWTPQKGDPIFVWNDHCSEELPCDVKYYHSTREIDGAIITCSYSWKNEIGSLWEHCRRFDPKLVGVPRKDWPPEDE